MITQKMICNNSIDVLKKLRFFNYFLFKEKQNDKIILGRYIGVSTLDNGISFLCYQSVDMDDDSDTNFKINITNGLIIIEIWDNEPTDIEVLVIKNNFK